MPASAPRRHHFTVIQFGGYSRKRHCTAFAYVLHDSGEVMGALVSIGPHSTYGG